MSYLPAVRHPSSACLPVLRASIGFFSALWDIAHSVWAQGWSDAQRQFIEKLAVFLRPRQAEVPGIPVLPWSVPLRWQSPKPVGTDSDHMGECLLLWSLCGDGNQWRGLSRTWTMSSYLPENLRHISHIPYTTPPVSSITSTAGNGSFPHPAHLDLNFWFLCFKSTTLPKIHLFLWTKKIH